jgi:hypothetical protein
MKKGISFKGTIITGVTVRTKNVQKRKAEHLFIIITIIICVIYIYVFIIECNFRFKTILPDSTQRLVIGYVTDCATLNCYWFTDLQNEIPTEITRFLNI